MTLESLRPHPVRRLLRARLGQRGAVAIEYAILLPAFLLLVLGAADMGRLLWTQVTLDRFVQHAARCAVVTPATCNSNAAIASLAATNSFGIQMTGATYALATPACGKQVTVVLPFRFAAPLIAPDMTLQASACYPVIP